MCATATHRGQCRGPMLNQDFGESQNLQKRLETETELKESLNQNQIHWVKTQLSSLRVSPVGLTRFVLKWSCGSRSGGNDLLQRVSCCFWVHRRGVAAGQGATLSRLHQSKWARSPISKLWLWEHHFRCDVTPKLGSALIGTDNDSLCLHFVAVKTLCSSPICCWSDPLRIYIWISSSESELDQPVERREVRIDIGWHWRTNWWPPSKIGGTIG